MNFEDFQLSAPVLTGIREAGFTEPTPVQIESLRYSLAERDVTVQSQTGTGKTAAFLIAIFELLTQRERYKGRKALVVAPTRELAVQIEKEANLLGRHVGLSVACFYGGVGYEKQERAAAEGVDIIVGTPGRLLDFYQSKKLDFRTIGVCVIDEADRLFDMGFYPDIRRIMRGMVDRRERLTMLYSATLSVRVLNLAWEYMNDPAEVAIEPEHLTVDKVEQEVIHVSREEKMKVLLGLIERENPGNCLIFTNTKSGAEQVAKRLEMNGYSARFIMGDLPQKKRMRIIDAMKDGTTRFLVATDVAARGLHIDDLDLVVNYDVPEDPESYVHRIGRTARAGQSGRASTLACERYVYGLESIESLIGMKIPVRKVTEGLLLDDRSEGVHIRTGESRAATGADRRGSGRDGGRGRSEKRRRMTPVHSSETHGPSGGKGGRSDHPDPVPHGRRHDTHDHPAKSGTARGGRRDGKRRGPGKPKQERQRAAKAVETDVPKRDDSLNERLEYYRRKYGENFQPKEGAAAAESAPSEGERPRQSHSRGTGRRKQRRPVEADKPGSGRDPQSGDTRAERKDGSEQSGFLTRLSRLFGRGTRR